MRDTMTDVSAKSKISTLNKYCYDMRHFSKIVKLNALKCLAGHYKM